MEASTEPRTGDDLIEATARGAGVTPPEEDALLAYFLGDAPQPNANTAKDFEVDLGDGRTWRTRLRAIDWTEWQDAQKRAIDERTGNLDLYKQASFVVARATITPLLGRMLERIREAKQTAGEDPSTIPTDGADMLRRAFAKQSGSLIYLQRAVIEISKLDEAGSGGVREIEAAKTSS
jgi:monoamine oxidase